jgi:diadenosine tetraphosphate (Ap4A) HIT family hydrolase
MHDDWKRDRIVSAARGENPMVIARMRSGFAVIGDNQLLPGYCVLLAYPQVFSLNDLDLDRRGDFLLDMSLIGDALSAVCSPLLRINYSILGNTDQYLHAHIHPRYEWEPEAYRFGPPFSYPRGRYSDPQYEYDEAKHGELRARITDMLLQLMTATGENGEIGE